MEKKCCIVIEEVVYSINSLTNNLQFIKLVHPTNQHNKWLKCERVTVKLFRKSGQPAWCPCKLVKKRTNVTMNPDKKYWSSLALQLKYRCVTITVTTTRGISSYPVKLKATAAQIKQTFYMKKSNKMLLELCSVERCLQSCVSHLLGTTNMPLELFIAKVVKTFSVCVNCLNGCCLQNGRHGMFFKDLNHIFYTAWWPSSVVTTRGQTSMFPATCHYCRCFLPKRNSHTVGGERCRLQ